MLSAEHPAAAQRHRGVAPRAPALARSRLGSRDRRADAPGPLEHAAADHAPVPLPARDAPPHAAAEGGSARSTRTTASRCSRRRSPITRSTRSTRSRSFGAAADPDPGLHLALPAAPQRRLQRPVRRLRLPLHPRPDREAARRRPRRAGHDVPVLAARLQRDRDPLDERPAPQRRDGAAAALRRPSSRASPRAWRSTRSRPASGASASSSSSGARRGPSGRIRHRRRSRRAAASPPAPLSEPVARRPGSRRTLRAARRSAELPDGGIAEDKRVEIVAPMLRLIALSA